MAVASHYHPRENYAHFIMDIEELPGWRAVLRLENIDKKPTVTEIRISAAHIEMWIDENTTSSSLGFKPDNSSTTQDLSSKMLRKVAVDRLAKKGLSQIPTAIKTRPWAEGLSFEWKRVGRAGRNDLFYAERAALYVDIVNSGEAKPLVKLAEALHLSTSQVRGILGEARKRDLLSPAPKGRAGGWLTDKAEEMLGITETEEDE